MNGLSNQTSLELLKYGYETPEAIIKYIQKFENEISKINASQPKEFTQRRSDQAQVESTSKIENPRVEKYCHFHKTSYHDDTQCKKLPRKTKLKDKEAKSLLIKEPLPTTGPLTLTGNIGENNVNFILDTGAHGNFISENTAKDLQLKCIPTSSPQPVEIGSGQHIQITGTTTNTFTITELPKTSFKEEFRILPGNLKEIILGQNFLNKNSACIDYKKQTVRIAENFHYFGSQEFKEWLTTPDNYFIEKMHIVQDQRQSCYNQLYQLQNKTNSLSPIIGIKMIIQLHVSDSCPL